MNRVLVDHVTYRVPGSTWWRLHASLSPVRGDFEDGNGWMYAGLIHRWAKRVGPLNLAAMRLRTERAVKRRPTWPAETKETDRG